MTRDPLGEPGFDNVLKKHTPFAGVFLDTWQRLDSNGSGRWLNLYSFAINCPPNRYDILGLDSPGCDSFPDSPCFTECCALHDQCFDDHDCIAVSWVCTFATAACRVAIPPIMNDLCCPPYDDCDDCNNDVIDCMAACLVNPGYDDPSRLNFYCAAQDRFITIGPPPADFPDWPSANAACEENHGGTGDCTSYPSIPIR